jgi:hypothetical protein
MAIVYLLITLAASPSHPAFVHMEAYHLFAERSQLNVPCEEFIRSEADLSVFRKSHGLPAAGLQAQCVSAEEGTKIAQSLTAKRPTNNRTMKGRLIYEPLDSGRKSVAAYLGHEFFLDVKGEKIALRPGTVTAAQLKAMKGKIVEITAEYVEEAANPMAQTPLESDGSLMKRKYWKVHRLTASK